MPKRLTYTRKQFKTEFAKLIESISIPSNLPDAEIIKRYSDLFSFVEPHIPNKLFRFRKCNIDSIISFEQNTIPVCSASKFSDKYDSTIYYDHKTLVKRVRDVFNQFMPNVIHALKTNPSVFPLTPVITKLLELIQNSKSDGEILESLWPEYM